MIDNIITFITNSLVQCWGCFIFDKLYVFVSNTISKIYSDLVYISILTGTIVLGFYLVYTIIQNFNNGLKDPYYENSIQKTTLRFVIVFSLLTLGLVFPRIIISLAIEPTITLVAKLSQIILDINIETINQKISYTPIVLPDYSFFTNNMKDTILIMMKTGVIFFQNYIKLGFSILFNTFSWSMFISPARIFQGIIYFFIGIYILKTFFTLFVKYCFYYIDIIIKMITFSIFFPLSLVAFAFKDTSFSNIIKSINNNYGITQIKELINAIITLIIVNLHYFIIYLILIKFFYNKDYNFIITSIQNGHIFNLNVVDNLTFLNLIQIFILLYIINYLSQNIQQTVDLILTQFGLKIEDKQNKLFLKNLNLMYKNTLKYVNKIKNIYNK